MLWSEEERKMAVAAADYALHEVSGSAEALRNSSTLRAVLPPWSGGGLRCMGPPESAGVEGTGEIQRG